MVSEKVSSNAIEINISKLEKWEEDIPNKMQEWQGSTEPFFIFW